MILISVCSNRMKACQLPTGLEFNTFHYITNYLTTNIQYFLIEDITGLRLDVPMPTYRFDLDSWLTLNQFNSCFSELNNFVNVRFPKRYSLSTNFNLSGLVQFLLLFDGYFQIYLTNLAAIEIDAGINYENSSDAEFDSSVRYSRIDLFNSRLDFKLNGRPVKTCQQLIDANLAEPKSLFQISPNKTYIRMAMINQIFIRPLCPLLFRHARISTLGLSSIINTFYKRNVLSFTNNEFQEDYLDSSIIYLNIHRSENIEVDEKFLNPSVFAQLKSNYLN